MHWRCREPYFNIELHLNISALNFITSEKIDFHIFHWNIWKRKLFSKRRLPLCSGVRPVWATAGRAKCSPASPCAGRAGRRGPSGTGRGPGGRSADRRPAPPPAPASACTSGWSATGTPPGTYGGNINESRLETTQLYIYKQNRRAEILYFH